MSPFENLFSRALKKSGICRGSKLVKIASGGLIFATGELVFSSEDFLALETTSLMEWEKGEKIPVRKGKATFSLAPFEIRTFFLRKG